MDRKTVIAVALCFLVLILWRPILKVAGLSGYVEPPKAQSTSVVDTTQNSTNAVGPISRSADADTGANASAAAGASPSVPQRSTPSLSVSAPRTSFVAERTVEIETPLYRATFSNRGARLVAVELKHYASAHGLSSVGGTRHHWKPGDTIPPGDRVTLAGGPLFAVDLGSRESLKPLDGMFYDVSDSADAAGMLRVLTFTARDSSGFSVRQTYRVRPEDYALDLEVEMRGVPAAWRLLDYSLTSRSWPLLTDADLVADARLLRATSLVGTSIHHENAGGLKKSAKYFDGNAVWAAVQTRYFVSAVAAVQSPTRGVYSRAEQRLLDSNQLKVLPEGSKPEQEVAINSLISVLPAESNPTQRFVLYVGPCEYFRLASLKLQLERAVDLGWTWVLPFSKLLLQLLNWIFGMVRNYGVAILALATLVRLLLHPLNMMSMKSMRNMQLLQPEMERIKQKFKDDPQAMNTAVMALYKENKVNPAGGCLPMLIQMPLFIGLYQVLFNAIELRQAPFVSWMSDLSAPDLLFTVGPAPIRLLPILMLGSGLLSQRLTPSDPRQLPMMYMMNVVMLVFFYNLPSGLVLYWTVMNLLTAVQQWMVLRQGAPAVAEAVVTTPSGQGGSKRRRATVR